MLSELAATYPIVEQTFAEASEVIGRDLWALSRSGPAEKLADTRITQPLMFASGIAVWRALRSAGLPAPTVVAGHSLGEFAAMVAADTLSYSDGVALVKHRAELMATAVPEGEGGMAALLGMADDAVIALCNEFTGERICEAVNFNAPGQVALSGHLDALQKILLVARQRGARRAIMLAVSVPNHSSLMRSAGAELAVRMTEIDWQTPQLPLVQNATAAVPENLDRLLSVLSRHMFSPVQWTRSVETLRDQFNVVTVIEAGPGKVLSGLGKRIDRSLPHIAVDSPQSIDLAIEAATQQAQPEQQPTESQPG